MKKIFLIISVVLAGYFASAQIISANLQAAGLTCAMCTRAIDKSLSKVSFVKEVKPDIKSSSFEIVFKEGNNLNFDALGKAVEDAGFSVAKLELKGRFDNLKVGNDKEVQINGNTFHFLKVNDQTLNGEHTILLIDRNFLGARDFKKYNDIPRSSSGKYSGRIYNVTI